MSSRPEIMGTTEQLANASNRGSLRSGWHQDVTFFHFLVDQNYILLPVFLGKGGGVAISCVGKSYGLLTVAIGYQGLETLVTTPPDPQTSLVSSLAVWTGEKGHDQTAKWASVPVAVDEGWHTLRGWEFTMRCAIKPLWQYFLAMTSRPECCGFTPLFIMKLAYILKTVIFAVR
jgi:hypothetical protein